MPRYLLVAARDGIFCHQESDWPDEIMAKAWAAGQLALAFSLDPYVFDTVEKIGPETDGLKLVELEPDLIAMAAVEVVQSLSKNAFRIAPPLMRDVKGLEAIEAIARLARVLIGAGYLPST